MTDAPLVLPLEAIDPTDPDTLGRVGGKAANLGALVRAGFAVPAGVCLTTAAYRRAVGSALDALLAEGTDAAGLAEKARAAVLAVPIPDEVADAVRATCPEGPVAVRSSATAEDLPDASFAGQQDTFLNVVGDDAVLDAVRRCWASLWTDRAVAYRGAQGIDHAAVTLAVVIQSMVDARWAGVLFTADPVTGRRGQAVIDAAPGLGESVVSGSVDPEHLVVDPDGEIVSRHAGAGGTVVRAAGRRGHRDRGARRAVRPPWTTPTCGPSPRLGRQVEALFGAPQDIEWALDGDGRAWLTQSRPITTLYPLVPGRAGPAAVPLGERRAGRVPAAHAVGLSAARHLASGVAGLLGVPVDDPEQGPPMLSEAGERLFVDLTDVLRSRVGRAGAAGVLGVMEARSAEVIATQLDRPELAVTRRSPAADRAPGRPDRRSATASRAAVVGAWVHPARARDRAFDLVRRPARPCPRGRRRAGWNASTACAGCSPTASSVVPADRAGPGRRVPRPRAGRAACSAVAPVPASSAPCCAACRTTSPRRWTSRSGTSPSACATTPPPSPPSPGPRPRSSPGSRSTWPPVLADGSRRLPGALRPPRRRRDRPRRAALVRRPDPPARGARQLRASGRRRTRAGRRVRPQRRGGRGDDRRVGRARRRLRGRVVGRGPAPGPRPRRPARAAEVLAGHGARGRRGPSSRRWAPTWRPGAVWRRADDVFFLSLAEAREDVDRRAARARAARDLRARAAAPARAADRALRRHRARGAAAPPTRPADGALAGVPASAGTVTGRVRVIPTRRAPASSPATCSCARRPTPAGRRCSSPPAGW